jgi:hypothetical protein
MLFLPSLTGWYKLMLLKEMAKMNGSSYLNKTHILGLKFSQQ